ncbi:outer membrane protein assembly factor BamB family protein [Roseiconus lacunae]|uniref:outer membrane protein assembly factor BamB family protein n=1 Tax=Roseiconus lacunae TaxID=2605694 RepID=UPI0011F16E61|nr:PQQ-binding-like beta-propeller repeat protein [Roseiconus lacunae]
MFRQLCFAVCAVLTCSIAPAADWSQFRGPATSGKIEGPAVPTEWSSEKNLRWKTELPGKGTSSPIIVGNRVFLTAYTGYGIDRENPGDPKDLQRHLLAFDRTTGTELWRQSVGAADNEDAYQGFITQHGYASSTPVSDGQMVYVVHGKAGLYAYTVDGELAWNIDLGQKSDPAKWGDGASPILVGDVLVVDANVMGNQLLGIDKRTGNQRWAISDPKFTNGWSTPTPVTIDGQQTVLFNLPNTVIAVDPATGQERWRVDSPLDDAACGCIAVSGDRAFWMGSRAGRGVGVRLAPSDGKPSGSVLWQTNLRSGICSPLAVNEQLYWCTGGIFYSADVDTGEYVYKERLPRMKGATGGFPNADYSSPIAVAGKIIQFTRNGESYVVEPGEELTLVSHNPPFEGDSSAFSSTPAASDGELFVRSESYLYCIAKQ